MRTFLFILLLASSLIAQTRAELDEKYGPIEGGRYRVRPGIAVEATFSESGKATALRIVPDDAKDKNALLRPEDARKVVRELAGNRMCRGPKSSSRIDIACPPRKRCFGVKEVWKSLTTLIVWHKDSVVYLLVTPNDPPAEPPPGTIKLLPGYEHVPGCGIDTRTGRIQSSSGISIQYDIGGLTGNFASQYQQTAKWKRTEWIDENPVLIVLAQDDRIFATFSNPNANFWAKVSSQADIDDFLKMVLTYKPFK